VISPGLADSGVADRGDAHAIVAGKIRIGESAAADVLDLIGVEASPSVSRLAA
jgi:hypothetical protein